MLGYVINSLLGFKNPSKFLKDGDYKMMGWQIPAVVGVVVAFYAIYLVFQDGDWAISFGTALMLMLFGLMLKGDKK